LAQPETEIPNEQHTLTASPEDENALIVKTTRTDSHISEQTSSFTEPSSIDNTSTEAQHGSIRSEIQNEDTTDKVVHHDANPFWNVLKIMRQSNKKGKIQYLIRWEDRNYPDTWTNASDVNDKLKRVFYLTHTKQEQHAKDH